MSARSRRTSAGAARVVLGLVVLAATLVASGCSVFTSYVGETEDARRQFESLAPEAAVRALEGGTGSSLDRLCYLLERGLILHASGDLPGSNRELFAATDEIKRMEDKAIISASDTASQAGSLLVNEKTIAYQGEPFEHVLLHAYLAMNFMFSNDLTGARVEIRKLQGIQKEIRERAKEEAADARDTSKGNESTAYAVERSLGQAYADQDSVAARVQNLYDDALSYALSALVYEMNGEPNDAFIDLKRAIELRPEIADLKGDAYRAALRSGLRDEAQALREAAPSVATDPGKDQPELVVLFESGDAPLKREISLPIPTGTGLTSIALPKYQLRPNPYTRATVRDGSGTLLGATALYTDVEGIAVRTLRDRMAVLALKQAIRAVGKAVVAKQVADASGHRGSTERGVAIILMSLYNVLTEQADLRSWTTLPASLQWVRIPMAPGEHQLSLRLEGSGGAALAERSVTVSLAKGERKFVNVRTTGPAVYLNVYPKPAEPTR
ncbi:MAG: hypothetical protein IPK07_03505 [Deltaproteobacteria bacterium]|nr:hypothetical protein [Deltaproteobacteria bacterium]